MYLFTIYKTRWEMTKRKVVPSRLPVNLFASRDEYKLFNCEIMSIWMSHIPLFQTRIKDNLEEHYIMYWPWTFFQVNISNTFYTYQNLHVTTCKVVICFAGFKY
jgi:hypothetical protein